MKFTRNKRICVTAEHKLNICKKKINNHFPWQQVALSSGDEEGIQVSTGKSY